MKKVSREGGEECFGWALTTASSCNKGRAQEFQPPSTRILQWTGGVVAYAFMRSCLLISNKEFYICASADTCKTLFTIRFLQYKLQRDRKIIWRVFTSIVFNTMCSYYLWTLNFKSVKLKTYKSVLLKDFLNEIKPVIFLKATLTVLRLSPIWTPNLYPGREIYNFSRPTLVHHSYDWYGHALARHKAPTP